MKNFMGYGRADGSVGIRNYILVESLVQCANSTVDKIAAATGAHPIKIDTGCGEFDDAAQRTNLGLICAGRNPNVYGVLLVSLGCQWTDPKLIQREIELAGTKVFHLCIQDEGGMANTIRHGTEIIRKMQSEAESLKREEFPLSKLIISLNSGGSDWTSSISSNPVCGEAGDRLIADGGSVIGGGTRGMPGDESYTCELAVNKELGLKILDMVEDYCEDIYALTGERVQDVNPTPGNKAGGITTLAEKAMGNSKMQGTAPLQGLLELGERPPYPGAWFIDERHGGNDTYLTTAFAMCGANLMLFTTGRGTPQGNAVMPIIKITGNPDTDKVFGDEMIDYSCAGILDGSKKISECGEELYELICAVAEGKETKAEIFGDYSYAAPPASKL